MPTIRAVSTKLIFHVRKLYEAALESIAQGKVKRVGINGPAEYALLTYIISVAAVEAFINEFILGEMSLRLLPDKWPHDIPVEWFEKMELDRKLVVVPHILFGQTFQRDQQPYQDMHELIKIRNALTHYKWEFKSPSPVQHLEDQHIAFSGDESWLDKIKTTEGIRWANNTACKTVHKLASFSQENAHSIIISGMAESFLIIEESYAREFLSARGIDPDSNN